MSKKIEGTVLITGKPTANDVVYTKEAVQKAVEKLKGQPIPIVLESSLHNDVPMGETVISMDGDKVTHLGELFDDKILAETLYVTPRFEAEVEQGEDGNIVVTDCEFLSVDISVFPSQKEMARR